MSASLKTIPLCQLRPSPANIRKTYPRAHIAAMAADIARRGLLENLVVYPVKSGRSLTYEVDAGGLRYAALKLLAKRRKIARNAPVDCRVLAKDANRTEVSLAENAVRLALHPADEFEAFAKLVRAGQSETEVAAVFRVTPAFVKQRLKLATLSPRLIGAYREGSMTLDQLTAFTLSDDHAVQEALWFERPYANLPPAFIRQALTEAKVRASDPRARFVGLKAYEARGGVILRDLFDTDDEGYLADGMLLETMVAEKLEAAAQAVRGEGWQWVEVHPMLSWSQLAAFDRAETVEAPLKKSEAKQLTAWRKRRETLIAQLENEEDEDGLEQLEALESDIAPLEAKARAWPDNEKARAGAIVSIDHAGGLIIERGLVRSSSVRQARTEDGEARSVQDAGYSRALREDLSQVRTAALRIAVTERSDVAMIALVHALAGKLLYDGPSDSCFGLSASQTRLEAKMLEGSKAQDVFQQRHTALLDRLPEREALWSWLTQLDLGGQLDILAHCLALTINALEHPSAPPGKRADADMLAGAIQLDINSWWRPGAEGFFNRLTRSQIMDAVREGVSPEAAQRLGKLSKLALAKEAERLLRDGTWLPMALRAVVPNSSHMT